MTDSWHVAATLSTIPLIPLSPQVGLPSGYRLPYIGRYKGGARHDRPGSWVRMIRRLAIFAIPQITVAVIAAGSVAWAQPSVVSAPTVTVEARIVTDSGGCPVAVELWLLGTPDSIAGVEAVMAWDRPDLAHFLEAAPESPLADSAESSADSVVSSLMPQGKIAKLEVDAGLLADWSFRQARLRTQTTVKVVAVADFIRAGGATPIPTGAKGRLWRLPVILQSVPRGVPRPDSLVLYLEPGQLRISDKRGNLIDVVPPQPVTLDIADCEALQPRQ